MVGGSGQCATVLDGIRTKLGFGTNEASASSDPRSSQTGKTYSRRTTLTALGVGVAGVVGGFVVAASSPTGISDWHDLDNIRNDRSGSYELSNDLDSSSSGYDSLVDTTDGWVPIDSFTGTFDGKGHHIGDLVIDRGGTSNVGLFGDGMGGTIQDVGLVDVDITGGYNTGSLVGTNTGTVSRVFTSGSVTGTQLWSGGVVGYNDGTIEDAYSLAVVDGDTIGGLVGYNNDTVRRCVATGDVAEGSNAGGLAGEHGGTLEDAYWDKAMTNQDSAIGLGAGSTSNVVGHGSTSESEATDEMQGIEPKPSAEGGSDTMDGLDWATWKAVIQDEPINPTPASDGYPILSSIDVGTQLDQQGIEIVTETGGSAGTIIIRDSTFENNSEGISFGDSG